MAEMQRQNEIRATSLLGYFYADMMTYFATAKHVMNEAEDEKLVPVVHKLLDQASRERFSSKEKFHFSIHLVEEDARFWIDHSFWPGRIFISSIGQNLIAVDEVGLATIVSHSLAHSYLNHRGELLSWVKFKNESRYPVPILGLLAIASKQMRIPAAMYCLCLGAVNFYGLQLRTNIIEKEADTWALEVMKSAGYDVTKATEYWERKIKYILTLIDSVKIQRQGADIDANDKKNFDGFIKFQREELKLCKRNIETIEQYIYDNDIQPLPVEEPKPTEDPPKSTESEDKADSDVPESKQ
ncbi:hypothetical protein NHQ30_009269 [Ciborinia camelliae]|nr:hypothetical protein NHQ30_009269 [Ciborinia camelliae]